MRPESRIHKSRGGWLGLILFVVSLSVFSLAVASASLAQVASPVEIKDPALRALQQQYMDDLTLAGEHILAPQFDYLFHLSRKLDLDQAQQQPADRHTRAARGNGQWAGRVRPPPSTIPVLSCSKRNNTLQAGVISITEPRPQKVQYKSLWM